MSGSNRKTDNSDQYEKPSKQKQWHERSERPVAARAMTKDDIEEHRRNLVLSYGCEDSDITYDFQKIFDENDEDRDDCIWLKYKMKCIEMGKPRVKEIFTIKLPIPDELRRVAENLRRQQASRAPAQRKPIRALPAPIQPVIEELQIDSTTPNTILNADDPSTIRPKLRKPVRTPGRIVKK